jgi:hypothetical protein
MRTPISDDRLRRSQGHIRSGDAAFLAGNFERAYDQYAKVDDTFDSHWGSLDQKAILADACSKCGRCRVSSTHFQAAVNVLNKVLEQQQTTFEKADGTTEALALPAMDAQHVASRYWRARARWDFSEMCSVQRRGHLDEEPSSQNAHWLMANSALPEDTFHNDGTQTTVSVPRKEVFEKILTDLSAILDTANRQLRA